MAPASMEEAMVTDSVHPNIVTTLPGYSNASANDLTNDESRDPVSAYPGFRGVT